MNVCVAFWVAGAMLLNIEGSFCQLDVCGRALFNTRIAGGGNAAEGAWPWQVKVLTRKSANLTVSCGGSLIHKTWVLTAAQCVQGYRASDVSVSLGRWRQTASSPGPVLKKTSQVFIHQYYDKTNWENDIALLQLSSSVTFTSYIRPVCLAAAGSTFAAGTNSWVTGWGKLSSNATQYPDVLQEVEIPIVNNSDCKKAHEGIITITDNMMCAGQGEKGICTPRDRGSPLVSKQGSKWIQSGIVSFYKGCADPKYPGVFTRVSQYQSWINFYLSRNQPSFVLFPSIKSSSSRGSPNLLLFSFSLTFSIIPLFFCLHLFLKKMTQ